MTKCKICANDTRIIYDEQFDIKYFKCVNCEFIHMDEVKRVSFEAEREVYDLHENSIECEGYVNMFHKFLSKAVVPFKDKGKGLDFGSGPEPVLMQLINRDYNFEMENYDLHYKPEKIYIGKKYDLIVSTEVVEHLDEPMEIFKLIYDLLEDGGIFAFMTILHENDDEIFKNWWYRRDKTHISFFCQKTLENIAEKIGFKFLYSDGKRIFTFQK